VIFQVAMMHELIGNGTEAEVLLRTGKEISNFHGLLVFSIAFTSSLGTYIILLFFFSAPPSLRFHIPWILFRSIIQQATAMG